MININERSVTCRDHRLLFDHFGFWLNHLYIIDELLYQQGWQLICSLHGHLQRFYHQRFESVLTFITEQLFGVVADILD